MNFEAGNSKRMVLKEYLDLRSTKEAEKSFGVCPDSNIMKAEFAG